MTAEAEEGSARERPRFLGRPVELPLWMVGVLAAAPLLLGLLLWSLLDRRTSHVSPPPVAAFEELLPSIAGVTGSPIVDGNVRLYQYLPSLLHQKVLVVDGLWSHVGSTNFDSRSFEINDEVSVGLIDEVVAERLADAFRRDVRDSHLVTLEEWRGTRSVWHLALDRLAHLVHEQL